jgi:hypothetical protein
MMASECFFKSVYNCTDKDGRIRTTTQVKAIITSSEIRNDDVRLRPDLTDVIHCHKNCISRYISPSSLRSVKRLKSNGAEDENENGDEPKRLRSSIVFDFRQHCLFCKEVSPCILPLEYDSRVPAKYRISASMVTTDKMADGQSYKQYLLDLCERRGDELAIIVRDRILGATADLHAADARYHRKCSAYFHTTLNRDKNTDTDSSREHVAFNETVNVIKHNRTKIWNSIDLEAIYCDKGGCEMSRRTLVQKINEHFGDELVLLNSTGAATMLAFKSHVATSLRLVEDDQNDDMEECIRKVAKQIAKECTDAKAEFNSYSKHIDKDLASECISPTLMKLLSSSKSSFENSFQSLMIGNIVSSVLTNQPTPLQVAIGVFLGHHKMLITELYKYGVCCSYDEVRRFKRSAAAQTASTPLLPGLRAVNEGGLIQIIIDNFDAMISSQNCRLECHYMAMLAVQWKADLDRLDGLENAIPRLSKEAMKCPIPWDTPVTEYHGPKKPAMPLVATHFFEMSADLVQAMQVSFSRARELDFNFLRDILFKPNMPEYNGYNTRQCRETGLSPAPKSAVVYLPLINMKPGDPTTVLTSITRGLEVTRLASQDMLILTCDQAIYKIVVDISFHQQELLTSVVPILGGMHFIMDFVGCVGTLMADSGLHEILAASFGSVNKMLQGKKYPQNVRALRLLTEELLRPVFEREGHRLANMDDLDGVLGELAAQSRTAKLWVNNVIRPTFLMMMFCRASHEGDWPLHIKTAEAMLPYMFAAHKYNYARYGLYFVRSMTRLDRDVLDRFCRGEQSLHHTAGVYNGQWSDMFIETNWMRKGHGPGGIIGDTESPQTMATWVYSMDATMTLTGDLMKMSGKEDSLQMTHKEESVSRIQKDYLDRQSLRATLESFTDPLDPTSHADGGLLNISTGQLAQSNVNVDRALEVGADQLKQFEASWPDGFYTSLPKQVITFAHQKKSLTVQEHAVMNQEAIYARVIGLLVSQRDLDVKSVLAAELTAYPPSMFNADGQMRIATGKSALKKLLQVEVSDRSTSSPTAMVVDVSALLWTLHWPANGTVETFVEIFKTWVSNCLTTTDVYLCFDRYFDYSTKSMTRSARGNTTRAHQLTCRTRLPTQDAVLKNPANKKQLNILIAQQILHDDDYLKNVTSKHKLVVSLDKTAPKQVSKGRTTTRLDLISMQEEADVIITQQAIKLAQENPAAHVRVVCDDTDVFALLMYFYKQEKLSSCITMQSPIKGRSCIDIKESAQKHTQITPQILALHALSGCDTVAATYGIGKAKAIAVAQKGWKLDLLGQPTASMDRVLEQATAFIASCYGITTGASSMTEIRQLLWAQKIGKTTKAPTLCSLPPTSEAFEQNVRRAHYQVNEWHCALTGDPSILDPSQYGWERDTINKSLVPRNMSEGVPYAPDYILKLVRCGCASQQPCKSGKCKCMGRQLPCTMFCGCASGHTCANPFNAKRDTADAVNEHSDDEN